MCGGGGKGSLEAHNPKPKHTIEIRRFTKKKGFTNKIPKSEEPTRKLKREREISEDPLKHVRVKKFTIKKEDKSTHAKGLLRRRDLVPWW